MILFIKIIYIINKKRRETNDERSKIALNGGLIGKAKEAKTGYENSDKNLQNVENEVQFKQDGKNYTGIDNIINGIADE